MRFRSLFVCFVLLACVLPLSARAAGVPASSAALPSPAPLSLQNDPDDLINFSAGGKLVNAWSAYSYDRLMSDIKKLHQRYPALVNVYSLGKTAGGRNIPLLVVGNPLAQRRIWVDASIHAREYMTSQIVMSELEFLLGNAKNGVFEGKRLSAVLQNVALHIAPMLNPDGVELSRHGLYSAPAAFRSGLLAQNAGADFRRWKANLSGVDLNRNFPAGWDSIVPTEPSAAGYKGTAPLSETESAAAARYLQSLPFCMSISYHCTGGEIYWHYNQPADTFARDYDVATGFSVLTGYPLVLPDPSTPVGGLKDFVVCVLKIPAITIELRSPKPAPIPQRYFRRIFDENALVLWHALNLYG